ncbi:MAG: hypothetical protein GXO27_00120 [Chlorobi bacterium]|nr:hypothetical protein [Chlorobiota bacterium]
MKILVYFLLAVEGLLLVLGLWHEWKGNTPLADRFLGWFTLILFFLVIPLFLYWRFKHTDISRYRFPGRRDRENQ